VSQLSHIVVWPKPLHLTLLPVHLLSWLLAAARAALGRQVTHSNLL